MAPVQAASGEGELTLTMVDPSGAKLSAVYYAVPVGSISLGGSGLEYFGDADTETVPSARYGIVAMSPWGGLLCAGVTPCDASILFGGAEISVAGVVDVPEEGTASYTFQAPTPGVVVGSPKAGATLAVDFSEPMDRLYDLFGGLYGNTQWLRDGVVIPGATGTSYSIRIADVGHTIQPRISSSGLLFGEIFGSAGSFAEKKTLTGKKIEKVRTKANVTTFRRVVPAGLAKSAWVDVVSAQGNISGKVTVQVGKWKKTKRLWNGNTRVLLPKLKRGRYAVKVSYPGTDVYAPSKDRIVIRVK
ncbi:hypothetical protein [Nocardioides sp. W7]|uniref:hypothetical protein n=1 Tax=Nocardioides sp. W7 TaxID=2931390 RepID=UPI001FD3E0F8|nr:hypothetical protein [Nocardioides sp. W7]